jgi:hypothetical protein
MSTEREKGDEPSKHYVVVARARASAIFRDGERLNVNGKVDGSHTAQIVFRTRYRDAGYSVPLPEDLWVEITSAGNKLLDAATYWTNGARDICAVMAVSTNAAMGDLECELAYECTPNSADREFFQRLLPEGPITVIPGRRVDATATALLISAVDAHADAPRLRRAVGQYSLALEDWRPGREVLALSHLFMAAEAMKEVALRHHLSQTGLSAEALANSWGYDAKRRLRTTEFLLAESRRRLVFADDAPCHTTARQVSDEFEHGFVTSAGLRERAAQTVEAAARHVRKAILQVLNVPEETRRLLLSAPYYRPRGPLEVVSQLTCVLRGGGELSPAGSPYPMFGWKARVKTVAINPNTALYEWTPEHQLTPKFADSISANMLRVEMWDGSVMSGDDGTGTRKPSLTGSNATATIIAGPVQQSASPERQSRPADGRTTWWRRIMNRVGL